MPINFTAGLQNGRDQLEDPGRDEKIIVKFALEK
jgi:hypothetical protein